MQEQMCLLPVQSCCETTYTILVSSLSTHLHDHLTVPWYGGALSTSSKDSAAGRFRHRNLKWAMFGLFSHYIPHFVFFFFTWFALNTALVAISAVSS